MRVVPEGNGGTDGTAGEVEGRVGRVVAAGGEVQTRGAEGRAVGVRINRIAGGLLRRTATVSRSAVALTRASKRGPLVHLRIPAVGACTFPCQRQSKIECRVGRK